MPVAIITGAGGLIGSEAVEHFVARGLRRRRHRERHAGQLLRPRGLDLARDRAPRRRALRVPLGERRHPRPRRRSTRSSPSTPARSSWSSTPPPSPRTTGPPATRTPTSPSTPTARSTCWRPRRRHCPDAPFVFTLDEQGLRRHPNRLPLVELETRWEIARVPSLLRRHRRARCRSTSSTHSLFGVSKVAADVLVQEYGRYFGMHTVVFRGGCLTGPNALRRQAARLPRLPDEVHRHRHRPTPSSATRASRSATTSTAPT